MSFVAMSRIINTLIVVQKKEVNYYKILKWRTPIRKNTFRVSCSLRNLPFIVDKWQPSTLKRDSHGSSFHEIRMITSKKFDLVSA